MSEEISTGVCRRTEFVLILVAILEVNEILVVILFRKLILKIILFFFRILLIILASVITEVQRHSNTINNFVAKGNNFVINAFEIVILVTFRKVKKILVEVLKVFIFFGILQNIILDNIESSFT